MIRECHLLYFPEVICWNLSWEKYANRLTEFMDVKYDDSGEGKK